MHIERFEGEWQLVDEQGAVVMTANIPDALVAHAEQDLIVKSI